MKTFYICFPGGKSKALSLSYDDGRTTDRRLVEIFNKKGIKGTFHFNSGFLGMEDYVSAPELKTLYAGHEVAAHTFSHPTLYRCPKEQVLLQILEDRKRLEDAVGYTVRGLSYPYGAWNRELVSLLPGLGIEYARTVNTTGEFWMKEDFLTWMTTCHHNGQLIEHARKFLGFPGKQALCWLSVWGHSYEFDRDGNWDLIESFVELLGNQEDIWYTTVINMVDYMKAARAIRVAVSGNFAENPSAQAVWISVDGKIIEIPAGGYPVPL